MKVTPDLAPFIRELKATPERADLEVRRKWRASAARVRDLQRARAGSMRPASGNTRPSGQGTHWRDLIATIRADANTRSPSVAMGGGRAKWALGFEFGSKGGVGKTQFPPWSGPNEQGGRFFWPVFREEKPRVAEEALEALEEVFFRVFNE